MIRIRLWNLENDMKSTLDPDIIYDVFDRHGFPILRIDQFDKGNYAEIRAELDYSEFLTTNQLTDIIVKLSMIEKDENIEIRIVHIDMIHRTIRLNIYTKNKQQKKGS